MRNPGLTALSAFALVLMSVGGVGCSSSQSADRDSAGYDPLYGELDSADAGARGRAGIDQPNLSNGRSIRRNPSPDLMTLHQREVDVDNALTVTFDENLRMFWQDLGRAFYTDRPSRLTREPVPVP